MTVDGRWHSGGDQPDQDEARSECEALVALARFKVPSDLGKPRKGVLFRLRLERHVRQARRAQEQR